MVPGLDEVGPEEVCVAGLEVVDERVVQIVNLTKTSLKRIFREFGLLARIISFSSKLELI
jgi:hypothetical protein